MEKERYEAIKEMTETRNTGVANAYLKGNDGQYTKFYFEDTPENIANLIEEFKYTAHKVIFTDLFDQFKCESVMGGYIMSSATQELNKQIMEHLMPIQIEGLPKKEVLYVSEDEYDEFYEIKDFIEQNLKNRKSKKNKK